MSIVALWMASGGLEDLYKEWRKEPPEKMSGGSYDYIHIRSADELFEYESRIERMAERLSKLRYAEDAAAETEELLLIMRQYSVRVETRLARLRDVWQAVEWWDSGDWGEDSVKEALERYRTK